VQVNLSSDSPFSQLYVQDRDGKYRLTICGERGSIVVTINRKDLEAIETAIADTLRPIPTLTDTLDTPLAF
jgi:hypothetical protein